MQFWSVDELSSHADVDHEVGEEISPGVVVKRRTILRVGMSVAGLALLGGFGSGCASAGRGATLAKGRDLTPQEARAAADAFVAQVMPKARALIAAPAPDEEAYLTAVTTMLSRLDALPKWRTPRAGAEWSVDRFAYYPPIVLMQIDMAPNSVIHLHDHRHYNGVLLATKGAARCRNFDIVQPDGRQLDIAAGEVPAENEDFLIRENADKVLRPRELSTLTRDRDNIHHVEASDEGATLLDFFTHFSPQARSYGLDWDEKPYDAPKKLYKVAWRT